ncbi:hypothetical protein NXS19_002518 [Fusarium pseudograminearum]|nr:hypothetical protein NXS19_002518 [Fusarium pseudograminearum]
MIHYSPRAVLCLQFKTPDEHFSFPASATFSYIQVLHQYNCSVFEVILVGTCVCHCTQQRRLGVAVPRVETLLHRTIHDLATYRHGNDRYPAHLSQWSYDPKRHRGSHLHRSPAWLAPLAPTGSPFRRNDLMTCCQQSLSL